MDKNEIKTVAQNKKAYHDYFVIEEYEAGIELFGTEIKSIRQCKLNLKDSWCNIVGGEIFVNGMHISPYDHGNIFNRDPLRVRKLLMHKKEINRLYGTVKQDGLSLIPLSVYFKKGRAKVKVGLCKGKKLYDKREDIAKKDAQRKIQRTYLFLLPTWIPSLLDEDWLTYFPSRLLRRALRVLCSTIAKSLSPSRCLKRRSKGQMRSDLLRSYVRILLLMRQRSRP